MLAQHSKSSSVQQGIPVNTRRGDNYGLKFGHRLRRWPSIKPLFFQRIVFNTIVFKKILGSPRARDVACSASNRQGSNLEFCVWRAVSSHSSHHTQELLLVQFSLHVHKSGLKPDSFHFFSKERLQNSVKQLALINGSSGHKVRTF